MSHLLAIQTYGKQRVRGTASGAMLTAYKLGYTSAARALILALFAGRAVDVTPPQASYHYVALEGNPSLTQNYLLLTLTDEELEQAEAVTRRHTGRAGVWRWLDDQWQALPTATQTAYQPDASMRLTPTGARFHTLSGEAAPAGIQIERVQRRPNESAWWWVSGETYPHRAALKAAGGRWSKKRAAWYFIGSLPASVQALVEATPPTPAPPIKEALPLASESPADSVRISDVPSLDTAPSLPDEAPAIRIHAPRLADDDAITQAIRQTTAQAVPATDKPAPSTPKRTTRTLTALPQSACGELTGSITGNVWCYGYALHAGVCLYLNMGGARTAVEAIRAKLAKGDIVSLVPWDAPAIELSAGEDADGKAQTGMFSAYLQPIPEAKFTSAILVHEWLTQPNYGGKSVTAVFEVTPAQAQAQLLQHITRLVNVPVFPAWAGYLWTAGQHAMLLRRARSGGGVTLWAVDLDIDAWTRIITGGLANGVIALAHAMNSSTLE